MNRKNIFALILSVVLTASVALPANAVESPEGTGVSEVFWENAILEDSGDLDYWSEKGDSYDVMENDTEDLYAKDVNSDSLMVLRAETETNTEKLVQTAAIGDRFTVDRIIYTVTGTDSFTVEATGCSIFLSGALNIPQTVTYNNATYSVTTVGSDFTNRTRLTSITIPEGVTTVADQAFLGCSNVTTINLPSTLQTFARTGLAGLETINLAEGNPFYSVVDGVLFRDNETKLWLYPSAKERSTYTIPGTVTTIMKGAFYYNQDITNLIVPDNVKKLELNAFYYCQGLQEITIGAGVTSFGEYNLYCCDNLKTVTLKGSYILGHHAINSCPKLETIIIDGQMRGYDAYALYNLPSLKEFRVVSSNYYRAIDGVLFNGTRLLRYPASKEGATYVVPEGTTEIAALAFCVMQNTSTVILTPGITLNAAAFSYPNETTPMQIYFRDISTVSIGTTSPVFCDLYTGSKIYGRNQSVVSSINSYADAIESGCATVEVGVIPATGISFDTTSKALPVGESFTLTPALTPYYATEEIIWSTSDDSVATVDNGVVTAAGGGNATITATVGTNTATCDVKVTVPLQSIHMSTDTLSLKEGDTSDLTVSFFPDNTTDNCSITWQSSDTNIVSVDNGRVTAKSAGEATITATVGSKTATCTVTVQKTVITEKGWVLRSEGWYYLNADGTKATGWQKINGTWYYFHGSGVMATGWQKIGNTWYYLKSSGAMATGWQKIGSAWYYLKSSGAMATGWQKIGSAWYYLKSSGAMATGWQKIGSAWYYLKSSGAMATGWQKVGNAWYYLKSNGAMAASEWVDHGRYYVNSSGKWIK